MKTSSCYQVLLKMWSVIYLVFNLILLAKKHVGIQNLIKKYKIVIIQNLLLKLKAIENSAFLNNFDSVIKQSCYTFVKLGEIALREITFSMILQNMTF